MINVTKSFLPPFDEYVAILKRAWDKAWITNHGELVQELEEKLASRLGVPKVLFCSNGTIPLQMAIKAMGLKGEIITTPFSYVATTNAILWEGCTPVFVDIDPQTFCIDADKIEAAITQNTQAILATHVYGLPCNIGRIAEIAQKYKLKVIYDAAHAFGCEFDNKSLLSYGDVSTCSFHATKIFHTVEGGCIISANHELTKQLALYRSFGHIGDEYFSIGINGKNSEFHAAMGLAVLPKLPDIISERRRLFDIYNEWLPQSIERPNYRINNFVYNYAYYPVFFPDENIMRSVKNVLADNGINTRRYFYPSLNTLSYLTGTRYKCPISENYSSRVLSLPMYPGLKDEEIKQISRIIQTCLE